MYFYLVVNTESCILVQNLKLKDMNSDGNYTHSVPVYRTKSEVIKAANGNREFFDSYSDSLKNAWRFYERPN